MNQFSHPDGQPDTPPAQSERDAEDQSRQLDRLHERLRFETLLARLSATFIHLPADEVDGQIERGLRQIVDVLQIDRSTLAQFSEDGTKLVATHTYSRPG